MERAHALKETLKLEKSDRTLVDEKGGSSSGNPMELFALRTRL
jgi:hypothetical protein